MIKHELLAPVGNLEMLDAAINAGADAVYLSGYKYGARTEKANFDFDTLKLAVERAHIYGLKVFVTLNTLVKQAELDECYAYIDNLAQLAIDAIIIQDLGIIRYIRHTYPTLECHGSTQMAVYDIDGVKNAAKLGLTRVVVARETPLKVIDEMLALDIIELEVFIHGALCYAYSGQCLLSSAVGGRSGNRGQCAQPCRLNYKINGQNVHAMNMADLSTIEHFEQLVKRPISAFKIEGRLRHPDYVFHTTKAYRLAIDGIGDSALEPYIDNMYQSFNRRYTNGHLLSDNDRLNLEDKAKAGQYIAKTLKNNSKYKINMKLERALSVGDALKIIDGKKSFGIEVFNIYKDNKKIKQAVAGSIVAIDYNGYVKAGLSVYRTKSNLLTTIRTDSDNAKKIKLDMTFIVDGDFKMSLIAYDGKNKIHVHANTLAESPLKRALQKENLFKSFAKLGNTPFRLNQFECQLAQPIYVSARLLNEMRREAVEALIRARQQKTVHKKNKQNLPDFESDLKKHNKLVCYVSNQEQAMALDGLDCIVFSDHQQALQHDFVNPAILPFTDNKIDYDIENSVMVSNIGHLKNNYQLYYDGHSTVMNHLAYDAVKDLGASDICISPELTERETETLLKKRNARYWAYGKLPVMYTRTCPLKASGMLCQNCSQTFITQNETVGQLNVTCHQQLLRYVTALPLIKNHLIKQYKGCAYAFFTDESTKEVRQIAQQILAGETISKKCLAAYQRPIK